MRTFFAQKALLTVAKTTLLTVMTTMHRFETLTAALLKSCCVRQSSSGQHKDQALLVTGWVGRLASTAEVILAEPASEVGRVI